MEIAWHHHHNSLPSYSREKITWYPFNTSKHYNYGDLSFPISHGDIDSFEKLNNYEVAVHIVTPDNTNQSFVLVHHSKNQKPNAHQVWLVLLGKNDYAQKHYMYVVNMDPLLSKRSSSSASSSDSGSNHSHYYHCLRCLQPFRSAESRDKTFIKEILLIQ